MAMQINDTVPITPAAAEMLDMLRRERPAWQRAHPEAAAAELEHASIMPACSRADYIRAGALAMFLAERAGA